jgi:hypothetical protein
MIMGEEGEEERGLLGVRGSYYEACFSHHKKQSQRNRFNWERVLRRQIHLLMNSNMILQNLRKLKSSIGVHRGVLWLGVD